ncbi:MAG: pyrroline-5-carboxylate reductase [Flavobacteriales bacterium]|nr:pyrroline-5-carboxylate reductase [Flavobacteriales bacterium]
MENKRIAIIGCGNLGLTIAHGLLDDGFEAAALTATRRNVNQLRDLAAKGVNVTADNLSAVNGSDVVVLAVKPYNVKPILMEISNVLDESKHILVCLATGITLAELAEWSGKTLPTFRAMPNTAADVNESMTMICDNGASTEQRTYITSLFDKIGSTLYIDESLMEAATILGACGIAYVLRFMRAMIQGGIEVGFDAKTATAIVSQTMKGASELIIQNGSHPESEIDKVTTPKGCTITGLNEMEHAGFSSALIKGIVASYKKIEKN